MKPFKYNPQFHSGKFRNRIIIQKQEGYYDELGQYTEGEWTERSKAWAMIKTLQGREYFAVSTELSTNTYRFVIHYQEGITGGMRILYKNRVFDIIEPPINDDELDQTLTIIAREDINNG